jgi:hypothetical protein
LSNLQDRTTAAASTLFTPLGHDTRDRDIGDLVVSGTLPRELNGVLFRNGLAFGQRSVEIEDDERLHRSVVAEQHCARMTAGASSSLFMIHAQATFEAVDEAVAAGRRVYAYGVTAARECVIDKLLPIISRESGVHGRACGLIVIASGAPS